MAPRETGNNAYSNFWGDKQRALWYVVVFSGVVNMRARSQAKSPLEVVPGIMRERHAKRDARGEAG